VIGAPPTGGHAKLRILRVPAGAVWYRIVHCRYTGALYFGKGPDGRWNDPLGKFGVLYVADSVDTAFAETFGHNIPDRCPPLADKFLDSLELEERLLYRIETSREMTLGLLQGAGLVVLNLDAGLSASREYAIPQLWSRWVYEAPQGLDGIRYPSRALPSCENTALFDRCRSGLHEQNLGPLHHWRCPALRRDIFDILDEQGWGLL
jgi:hypothetical protein